MGKLKRMKEVINRLQNEGYKFEWYMSSTPEERVLVTDKGNEPNCPDNYLINLNNILDYFAITDPPVPEEDVLSMLHDGTLDDETTDNLINILNEYDECNQTARHMIKKTPIVFTDIEDAYAQIPESDEIQDAYGEDDGLEYYYHVFKWGVYYIAKIWVQA